MLIEQVHFPMGNKETPKNGASCRNAQYIVTITYQFSAGAAYVAAIVVEASDEAQAKEVAAKMLRKRDGVDIIINRSIVFPVYKKQTRRLVWYMVISILALVSVIGCGYWYDKENGQWATLCHMPWLIGIYVLALVNMIVSVVNYIIKQLP